MTTTTPEENIGAAEARGAAGGGLPVNDLARSYQPRRVGAAAVSIGWNLALAATFVFGGVAERLYKGMAPVDLPPFAWIGPVYFAVMFAGYAVLNFPLELWFGYLEERQFGLAKDGVRAWARDWLIGTMQHGVMLLIGACLLLVVQVIAPGWWLVMAAGVLLALFLGTTYLAADLVPVGLFHLQPADEGTVGRLGKLIQHRTSNIEHRTLKEEERGLRLPPVVVYSHPSLREFAGGVLGLWNRQVMLISRPAVEAASDTALRFAVMHDLGHRRYHHNLLAALAGWAWVVLGLCASEWVIPSSNYFGHLGGWWTPVHGTPMYVAFLALTLSAWMALGEPVLAWLGRRMEYQADRFYLRHGGTVEEMQAALAELARQNLARTEALRRRETIFHPLPSISNRLHAAGMFVSV